MEKKHIAISLRKRGKTYGEIIKLLKVPKSTVCSWLKNVKLSETLKKKILERSREKWRKNIAAYNKIYTKIRSKEARLKREKIENEASKEIKKLSKNDLRLIGTALYWAEGNTKNRNRLQFSNSNPLMVKIAMRFFREVCNIPRDKITARIHLCPHTNQKKTLNYWSKITGLPKTQFKKTQIQVSRASKGKRLRNTLPFGTLHLTVSDTKMACKVKGWIKGISKKFNAGVVQ